MRKLIAGVMALALTAGSVSAEHGANREHFSTADLAVVETA